MFSKWMSFAAVALVVACSSTSSDLSKPTPPASMTPEQMMEKMVELGTPGAAHRKLEPLVGKFTATVHSWMAPGAPEETSQATETSEWILGGRFVQSKFEGAFGGQPFTGIGVMGYDNATGKYQMTWVDSVSTMMMPTSIGTLDASGKVFTFTLDWVCPIEGPRHTRQVFTIADDNHYSFEMFDAGPDRKEARKMLIEYTRAR